MHPFRKGQRNKFRSWVIRKNHVILVIWLIGIAISMPEYLMFRAERFCYNGQYYLDCRNIWPEEVSNQYTVFIYLITFAIPLSLLSYLYIRIGLKLWRRQMPGNVDKNRDLTMQTMRIKVIKMLFVVVILFAVSWLPLQTFSMVLFLYPGLRENIEYQSLKYNIFVATYFISHWLSMAHSCLNPLIYCFMNDKFRSDLQKLLCNGRQDSRLARTNSCNPTNNHKITIIINNSNNNNSNGCSRPATCCRESATGNGGGGTGREMLQLDKLAGQLLEEAEAQRRRPGRKSVQFRRKQRAILERTASTELKGDGSTSSATDERQPTDTFEAPEDEEARCQESDKSQTGTIPMAQLNWFSPAKGEKLERQHEEEEEGEDLKSFV